MAHTESPGRLGPLWPGLALTAVVAVAAVLIGGMAPVVGAPVIAILIGVGVAVVRKPGLALKPGITFASKTVLQGSVVLLGCGLSLGEVLSTGARSLPVLIGTLLAAFAVTGVAGRRLGLPRDLRTLIGVGTAICGASAIAASDAVIDADEADVSYAIATIFTFNIVAALSYPTLGHALGLSSRGFGLWAGTAINDLSSVVATGTTFSPAAASYGVIVKLTRTLAIVPVCLFLAARRGGERPGTRGSVELGRIFPVFILGFLAAVLLDSAGLVPSGWHAPIARLATWAITAALAAIGLCTDLGRIRQAGPRPLLLGAILWFSVGVVSLGLGAITNSL